MARKTLTSEVYIKREGSSFNPHHSSTSDVFKRPLFGSLHSNRSIDCVAFQPPQHHITKLQNLTSQDQHPCIPSPSPPLAPWAASCSQPSRYQPPIQPHHPSSSTRPPSPPPPPFQTVANTSAQFPTSPPTARRAKPPYSTTAPSPSTSTPAAKRRRSAPRKPPSPKATPTPRRSRTRALAVALSRSGPPRAKSASPSCSSSTPMRATARSRTTSARSMATPLAHTASR